MASAKPAMKFNGSTFASNLKIDLTSSKKDQLKISLKGEKGTLVKFEGTFKSRSGSDILALGKGFYEKKTGKFSQNELILSGKEDTVSYIPGSSAKAGTLRLKAKYATPDKPKSFSELKSFNVKILFRECEILHNNGKIFGSQTFRVGLKKQEGSTAAYSYTYKNSFGFTGEKGAKVVLRMKWDGWGSGHHHNRHSTDPLATGVFSEFKKINDSWESAFVLDGSNKPVNSYFTTKGVSGEISVTVEFKDSENRNIKTMKFSLIVGYFSEKLKELQVSSDIELVGKTDEHEVNHFGTSELIDQLQALAAEYTAAFDRGEFDVTEIQRVSSGELEDKPAIRSKITAINVSASGEKVYEIVSRVKPKFRQLLVNDMSLRYGVRFACIYEGDDDNKKLVNPFVPPHKRHMFGQDADISMSGNKMNDKQTVWFENNAQKYFPLSINEGNHYHVGLSP